MFRRPGVNVFRRMTIAASVVAAALAVAPPAAATELSAGCNAGGHNLSAWAYYAPAGGSNQWYQFDYLIWGQGTDGKSNVNIWLYENSAVRWSYYSPDDVDHNVQYSTGPTSPVYINAASQEWVKFEGIFDVNWSDPRCVTTTAKV
jgi:hypothetical protein